MFSNLQICLFHELTFAITQTMLKSPNTRAASRTVARGSSTGGHYVCVEELDIVKIKTLNDF